MASRAQSKMKMLEKEGKMGKLSEIHTLEFKFHYEPYESKEHLMKINELWL